MTATITAFDWVPDFARGHVRDLRVRWACEEVGKPYRVRTLSQGEQKSAAHRTLQPFGQVPTFEEDGLVLFESGAIVLHVAGSHPGLFPPDPAARAQAMAWVFAALNTIEPPIADHAIATLFERDAPWSAARLPSIEARIAKRLDEVAGHLGDGEWLNGTFTAGDLMMVTVIRMLGDHPLLAERPVLAAYVARGEARPAFARALAAQLADFTGEPPPGFAPRQSERETKQ